MPRVRPGRPIPLAPTPPDFDDWRLARFSAAELGDATASGADADYDKDGLANVLEYVFGTDPKVPGATRAAVTGGVVTRGAPSLVRLPGGGWRLVFARRKVAELGGLAVTPQTCATLSDWSAMTGTAVLLGDDGEIEILGLDLPLWRGQRLFPALGFRSALMARVQSIALKRSKASA